VWFNAQWNQIDQRNQMNKTDEQGGGGRIIPT
jgi:hypothetical protein